MPLAVENLTSKSSSEEIKFAISKSIKQCMDEGDRSQDQCVAMAYEIAREKTGKELGKAQ